MATRPNEQPTRAEVHRAHARALEAHIERLETELADARAWIASVQGQETLREALDQADAVVEELRQARQIDPAILDWRMTI